MYLIIQKQMTLNWHFFSLLVTLLFVVYDGSEVTHLVHDNLFDMKVFSKGKVYSSVFISEMYLC